MVLIWRKREKVDGGFLIRDHLGTVQRAGAGREMFLQNAFHAELLGSLEGLKTAASMGIAHIIIETDATLVQTALRGDDYRLSSMGGLITEIKLLMATEFASCRIVVCPHVCTKPAHELASFGCKLPSGSRVTWVDVPQFIEDVVSSDLAVTEE